MKSMGKQERRVRFSENSLRNGKMRKIPPNEVNPAQNKYKELARPVTEFNNSKSKTNIDRNVKSRKSSLLLGYDWISEVLESNPRLNQHPDEYFERIKAFRDSCSGEVTCDLKNQPELRRPMPKIPPKDPDVHECVHTYCLTNRLFPVPLNRNELGDSICAICSRKMPKDSTILKPVHVRVSLPLSFLACGTTQVEASRLRGTLSLREQCGGKLKSDNTKDFISACGDRGMIGKSEKRGEMKKPRVKGSHISEDLDYFRQQLDYLKSTQEHSLNSRGEESGEEQSGRYDGKITVGKTTELLLDISRYMRVQLQQLDRSRGGTNSSVKYPLL